MPLPIFILGATTALACGSSRPRLPPSRELAGVAWQYEVHAGRAGTDDLAIEARFAPGTRGDLGVDDDGAPFVHDVEYASGSQWLSVSAVGSAWSVPCGAFGCRVRYRFALRAAATTLNDAGTAIASGDVVVAVPSTWLMHPSEGAPQSRFRFHVSCEAPTRFAAGTHPSPNGAADTFEARASELDQSSFAVFGRFHEATIQSGNAHIVVAIAPAHLGLSDAEVLVWVGRAVGAIGAYLGKFPAERTLVVVQSGTGGATGGETLGDGGPGVFIRVGAGVDAARTRDDWVMTHELLHVALPSLSRGHAWLSEGIPTYVEPIVRARAGQITDEKFWRDLVDGLPQGLPEAGDEGLELTHTWGRTYWGGALFCFVADVMVRERTHNRRSLDDVLRGFVATGANVESLWEMDQLLEAGDRATGVQVLHELYDRMAHAPGAVDLAALWARLGVRREGDHVVFDDRAPLADLRRSITKATPLASQ